MSTSCDYCGLIRCPLDPCDDVDEAGDLRMAEERRAYDAARARRLAQALGKVVPPTAPRAA